MQEKSGPPKQNQIVHKGTNVKPKKPFKDQDEGKGVREPVEGKGMPFDCIKLWKALCMIDLPFFHSRPSRRLSWHIPPIHYILKPYKLSDFWMFKLVWSIKRIFNPETIPRPYFESTSTWPCAFQNSDSNFNPILPTWSWEWAQHRNDQYFLAPRELLWALRPRNAPLIWVIRR